MNSQAVNKELKRVIDNFGVHREIRNYTGDSELIGEFDYAYNVKTDGDIFCLQTQNGWLECPLKEVDWKILWDKLGNVPVNEDDELEESFEHFCEGTDKMDVWHWFEWFFQISLGEELYS